MTVRKVSARRERFAVSLAKTALLAATLLTSAATDAFAAGSISGRVTSSTTTLGLANTVVQVYDLIADDFAASATTDATGNYTVNLPAGTYALLTQNTQGYINEIYNNIPCSAVCDTSTVGQVVIMNSPVTGIDFVLDPGGRITGKVTRADGITPIAGVLVNFVDSMGQLIFTSAVSDVLGNYISDGGTATGNVYAFTTNTQGYQDEIYNNVHCANCDITSGTAIAVTLAGGASNINFALDLGGRITGTVRDGAGNPLANVGINIYDSTGHRVSDGYLTDGSGNYSTAGFVAGNYYASTRNTQGFADELYDNIPCANGNCPVFNGVTTPTAIVVGAPGTTASGKDFALSPGGTIAGTVTNAAGGAPLPNVFVGIFRTNTVPGPTFGLIEFLGGARTNALGAYSVVVPAGTYFAGVQQYPGFANQIYYGLSCADNCPVTNGTPINVTTGQTSGNINFALVAGPGSISGTVTGGGTALNGVQVQLLSSTGTVIGNVQTSGSGSGTGGYTFAGLAPGSYYVRTNASPPSGLINQLYNGVVCINCNVVTSGGTLVPVTSGGNTVINFALVAGGRISGTITNTAVPAGLLQGVSVQVFNASGIQMGATNSAANGVYTSFALPPGPYYVRTAVSATQNFIDEVWNDQVCVPCTVTTGNAVTVAGTGTTTANFALAAGGQISGTVTDAGAGGAPIAGMQILVFTTAAVLVKNVNTDASGNYTVNGLPNGDYAVRTNPTPGQNYVAQTYNGITANGVPIGTPVTVTIGAPRTGVNFALLSGGSLSGSVKAEGTNAPLGGILVVAYLPSGRLVKTATTAAGTGDFTLRGLQAGTYYVSTITPSAQPPFYVDELFDNMPCLGCGVPIGTGFPIVTLPCTPSCAPTVTTGTQVTITNGTTRTGVDFLLASGAGVITGTVKNAAGIGLLNVQVAVYNLAGVLVKSATSAANSGVYLVRGLAPGTYRARTIVSPATPYYTDVVFGNVPCVPCDVTTTGSNIVVTANTTTPADFVLPAGGQITGAVTDQPTGTPLASVDVRLYIGPSPGTLVKTTFSGVAGNFTFDGLPAGTYYARTAVPVSLSRYVDELYDNLPCVSCNVTTGTAIVVTNGAPSRTVNFALSPRVPTVVTNAATSVGLFGATLNGTVNPQGSSTTALFQYGMTTSYGSQVAVSPPPGSGTSPVAVSAAITGLACSTPYHFRAVGTNPGGTTNGGDQTFTTGACPLPTVITGAATGITLTGATLNGTVTPNGGTTTASFQYGLSTSYGSLVVATPPPGSGTSPVAVSATVAGLVCNMPYHFRAVATNGGGTTNGADALFTTGACGPTIAPIPNVGTSINTPVAVPLTVGSPAGAAGLTVTGSSSNPTLVPTANLVFGGSGASRTLTITPATNQKGATTITVSASDSTGTASRSFVVLVGRRAPGDVDGDGKSDVTVFRPSTGIWYLRNIVTGLFEFFQWGLNGDVPVTGDYDGDGKADVAVFRPSTSIWYVRNSSAPGAPSFLQWGLTGDIPVPGDYDGDGKTDAAVFRPSTGIWYVRDLATNTASFFQWGLNGDIPVPGDYDGDGKTDVAVFRPSTGIWYIRNSSDGSLAFLQWGLTGDIPVPGDYDGDGKFDAAVFRPSTGIWYVRDLATNTASFYQWGLNGDVPVAGDFDGDGKTDIAVFRPSTSIWYVRPSGTPGAPGFYQWGITGDIPILKKP